MEKMEYKMSTKIKAKRCKKCNKVIRSHNTSMLCTRCYNDNESKERYNETSDSILIMKVKKGITMKKKISKKDNRFYSIKQAEEILEELEDNETICKDCKKRHILQTADFGGKFNCVICGKLQTMVPSVGHSKVCKDCVKKGGFCKYCGRNI